MKKLLFALAVMSAFALTADPIRLHPDNPHYFVWRGKPTILITSAEHYGAVLNRRFNYIKYLDALAKDGLNLTRTFTGVYCEPPGAFKISRNTLAPDPDALIAPWARSGEGRYANGGTRFDLDKWDDAYFVRLKDFVEQAAKRNIIVELTLFCPFYKDDMWKLSPMNITNNINGLGNVSRTNVYTLDKNGGLLAVQEKLVRKIVTELQHADNVMYEICNEPYFGGVTLPWQHRIAETIALTELDLGRTHLITQNIANKSAVIRDPHPAVSVFNFHYANPPDAIALNWHHGRPIGDNETGFKGTADDHYRMEAWEFLLAGGALYNNLDYSFTVGHEDGSYQYPDTQPGGGNAGFRKQMKVLRDFLYRFDFLRMKPDRSVIQGLPKSVHAQSLAESGEQYAVYLKGDDLQSLRLNLPASRYRSEWINVITGENIHVEDFWHAGGEGSIDVPRGHKELALRLVATSKLRPASGLRDALLLLATFDADIDADYAAGDPGLYHAPREDRSRPIPDLPETDDVDWSPDTGKFGHSLQFNRKSDSVVFYRGPQNVGHRSRNWNGSVSFWMRVSPDEDLPEGYCDPLQIAGGKWAEGAMFVEFSKNSPREFRLGMMPITPLWNPRQKQYEQMTVSERPIVQVKRPPFRADRWTHVAFTFQNANTGAKDGRGKLYLDGKYQGELKDWQLSFGWNPDEVLLTLGLNYVGFLDEVAVFNRPLALQEIQTLFLARESLATLLRIR